MAHEYLFKTMERQGFDKTFIERIRTLFVATSSATQINGYISQPMAVSRSIRQGCPLSSILYAIYLDPLLQAIHNTLTQNDITSNNDRVAIIAYADDVTVIIHSQHEANQIERLLLHYEKASGAEVNRTK